MGAASVAVGGGMMLGAASIYYHDFISMYLSYGVLMGTAFGLGYAPPIAAVMQWFPDKKGVAAGLTIAGFGSGALVFAPLEVALRGYFTKIPTYLGKATDFHTHMVDGRLYVPMQGQLVEVVEAGAAEIAKLPYNIQEGLYVVGTGSTGAAESLAVLGGLYMTVMAASALAFKTPHPTYVPEGYTPPAYVPNVNCDKAVRTGQFHLLGLTWGCMTLGGFGLMTISKPMMREVFSGLLPSVVTASFASQFVVALAFANLTGRLVWSVVSDSIGRRGTFALFTIGSVPMYLALPTLVTVVAEQNNMMGLFGYIGCTALSVSIMGGAYACIPAYISDIFGPKHVAAIHSRMLLYMSGAALMAPTVLTSLRSGMERADIAMLLEKVSPGKFQKAFGVPMEEAAALYQNKELTISNLLALCPPGTIDPAPHIYDSTMYTLGGMMVMASLTHALVQPLPVKKVVEVVPESVTVAAVSGAEMPNSILELHSKRVLIPR
jgi:MFS family permease